MQCMPSLCEELSSAASRVPGTRSAVLTLALNSAVEGVLLHAKFDAGQRMHIERCPCVLDHNVMNVVMQLPAGLDLSVHDADDRCIARKLTVVGQSLEVAIPYADQSYNVVCDVMDHRIPDDGAEAADKALSAAAGRLSLERIALPVLPPPGPQRTVTLEAAEQHISQVDALVLAIQDAAGNRAGALTANALQTFGNDDDFVLSASHMPTPGDPVAVAALVTQLSQAVDTLADVRISADSAALSTVAARHFQGADLADFGRDFDCLIAQRGGLVDDIMTGRAIASSAQATNAICLAAPRRAGARRPAQNFLPQHMRADVAGSHSRTRNRLAFHALQTVDACIREHIHTVCGAGGTGALAKAARAFEMR